MSAPRLHFYIKKYADAASVESIKKQHKHVATKAEIDALVDTLNAHIRYMDDSRIRLLKKKRAKESMTQYRARVHKKENELNKMNLMEAESAEEEYSEMEM